MEIIASNQIGFTDDTIGEQFKSISRSLENICWYFKEL